MRSLKGKICRANREPNRHRALSPRPWELKSHRKGVLATQMSARLDFMCRRLG